MHKAIVTAMVMTEKIALNGLKTSGPLVAVWICPEQGDSKVLPNFCEGLTALRVNLALITTTQTGDGGQRALACIDPGDFPNVAAWVGQCKDLEAIVTFGSHEVGLLSIYPHQASLEVLGVALQALGQNHIPIHGLASSIAALTFVIDMDRVQEAARAVSGLMNLPPNATPAQREFMVRQG
jgi:aspartokinase